MKQLTKKQILKFKDGEISRCMHCNSMTHSIIKKNKLICGKCKRRKDE